MPPSPSKTLSPAELAKLEHAFATNPASEAYKPLAEAYLEMGRFMEAMVVCKKGVKAHPNVPDARVLLARVYADQGKDKKALEELTGALAVAPKDKSILRTAGALQMKSGETEAGKANLLKAWEADPEDAETKAALAQYKVEPPKPVAPDPPTEKVSISPQSGTRLRPSGQFPTAGPGTRASGTRPAGNAPYQGIAMEDEPTRLTGGNGAQARQSGVRSSGSGVRSSGSGVRRQSQVQRPMAYEDDEPSEPSYKVRRREGGKGRSAFIFLLVLAVVGAGGYFFYGQWHARRTREVNKALTAAGEQLKHDSFDSYKKACEAAERALDADSASGRAHAYLAYAWAIRWGEHGGGDEARQQAESHLQLAKKSDLGDFPYLYAADALIKTYGGKGQEALQQLDEQTKRSPSALMYLTLGIIQMNAGDLEHARENLILAQQMASSDPRVYAALGTLYRRRGEDENAAKNYDFALRYERDHAESVLGFSLLVLEQENPKFEVASRVLKKLIESDPPPSPRQLAAGHLARAYLISRVSAEIQQLLRPEDQKELAEKTGVPLDKNKAAQEVAKEEDTGFSLDRQNPDLHLIKGRRLFADGLVDQAAAELRNAIRMDPTRANYYVELAKILLKKPGGEKEAADALGDAIKRMGESPKLMVMLAQVYRKQGKLDDAIVQLRRALSDPKAKNPEARFQLGSIYLEQKKYPDSIDALSKAAGDYVGQGTHVAMADEEMGRAYSGQGDRVKADDAFKKAITADAEYAPSYFFYGQFMASDPRNRDASHKALQEYLRRDPKGAFAAEAQKLLGQ